MGKVQPNRIGVAGLDQNKIEVIKGSYSSQYVYFDGFGLGLWTFAAEAVRFAPNVDVKSLSWFHSATFK